MKKLLILTGPQGSGNHLFTKCFLHSSMVGGWGELTDTYWLGHHTEPFIEIWNGGRFLALDDLKGFDYWVTSISIPYVHNNTTQIPNIVDFYNQATKLGIDVQLGIITRDKNILEAQQTRVRGESTLHMFMDELRNIDHTGIPYHFISHESLSLHGHRYMGYLSKLFGFPTINNHKVANDLCNTNANKKYIKYIEEHWLDKEVKKACEESSITNS